MKPKILLRFASGLLMVYAVGLAIIYFNRHRMDDVRAQKVMKMMAEYKFNMYGQMRSFDETYKAMSLNLLFSLIALSLILWILSIFTERNRVLVRTLLIPVSFCLLGYTTTGFLFLFPAPAYISLISSVLSILSVFLMVNKNRVEQI